MTSIVPVPQQINGHPVLAAIATAARPGEMPFQFIVICQQHQSPPGGGPYVTWRVGTRDGREWAAAADLPVRLLNMIRIEDEHVRRANLAQPLLMVQIRELGGSALLNRRLAPACQGRTRRRHRIAGRRLGRDQRTSCTRLRR